MSIETFLAAAAAALTGWMPAGSRAIMILLSALVGSSWFLPAAGACQAGMAVCALISRRRTLRQQGIAALLLALPAILLAAVLQEMEIPDFITGVITITTGILFIIRSVYGPHGQQRLSGPGRLLFLAAAGCLGILPGAGVLSTLMLGGLLIGDRQSQAYLSAATAMPLVLLTAAWNNLSGIAGFDPAGVVICLGCLGAGLLFTPWLLRSMQRWFQSHTLMVFGLWRIFFGLVFLLVFCVL